MNKMILVIGLLVISSVALADRVLLPGERAFITGEYVSCQGGVGPGPSPIPPRPTRRIQVDVRMNRSCLDATPRTDGKALAKYARRCDENNMERRSLRGTCTLRQSFIDHNFAAELIARATTVIHEDQKNNVRDAASDKVYICEVEF